MKSLFSVLIVAFVTPYAAATVTFTFDQSGLRNSVGGTATNGMSWGLLFDTDGDGFNLGSYDSFELTSSNYFEFTVGGVATGDVFVFAGDENSTTPPVTLFHPALGNGTITSIGPIKYSGPTSAPALSLAEGNQFGVIWFPTNMTSVGATYGFANNSDFIAPSDGSAFNTFLALNTLDPLYTLTAVPEPGSSAMLSGMMAIAFCLSRRKRRRPAILPTP